MSKTNDGGNVYPVHERVYVGDGIHEDKYHDGMSLRDYFAGQAISGNINKGTGIAETIAEDAYKVADAMLKERDK